MKQNYVFISYSSKNQQSADTVRMLLSNEKIHSWMAPYDIPVGHKYAHVINDAIEGCKCFVLLLTEDSQISEHVEKEVDRAVTYKKPVIAIQLGKVILNSGFKYYLGNSQIVAMNHLNSDSEEWIRAISSMKAFLCLPDIHEEEEYRTKDFYEGGAVEKGSIGNDIIWRLESNGDLYINGSGELICSTLYGQTFDSVVVNSHLESIKERVNRLFIGDGIETIGEFSFYHFFNLSEIYVAHTVKKIATGAFKDCKNLRHIELPWQLKEIGLYAFQNCGNLENFELPEEVVISSEAFKNCHSLTVLEKHCNKSITIFQKAFENCTNLEKVALENVDLVGTYAFKGCDALNFLDLSFRKDGMIKKGQTLQSGAFAFSGVKEVHLRFHSLIKTAALFYSIEDNCFEACEKLTDVFFEEAIPYISDSAFPQKSNVCVHIDGKKHNMNMIHRAFGESCQIQRL